MGKNIKKNIKNINKIMDWNGLLKYSLSVSDGTKKSDFKPMSEEDKKWLSDAMEEYTFNEIKRCHELFTELNVPEKETKEDEEYRLSLFEELQDILDGFDRAKNLNNIQGY